MIEKLQEIIFIQGELHESSADSFKNSLIVYKIRLDQGPPTKLG